MPNTLNAASVLRNDPMARNFFVFIVLGIVGIFMQDLVLEVLGGRVFGMRVGESTSLQQFWNGAVLVAMLATTPLVAVRPAFRAPIATAGALGTGAALLLLALVAHQALGAALFPVLIAMGLCAGVFTGATVMLMSDMTIPGATSRYLGLWSLAQALGTSLAFVLAGWLHTSFVERAADVRGGYALIFVCEALAMMLAAVALRAARVRQFRAAVAAG
jgi:BCD family chlorophyll transporter-like MFS transporter